MYLLVEFRLIVFRESVPGRRNENISLALSWPLIHDSWLMSDRFRLDLPLFYWLDLAMIFGVRHVFERLVALGALRSLVMQLSLNFDEPFDAWRTEKAQTLLIAALMNVSWQRWTETNQTRFRCPSVHFCNLYFVQS